MYEDDEAHADHDNKTEAMDVVKELMIKLFNSCVTMPSSMLQQLRNQKTFYYLYFSKNYLYL